MPEQSRTWILAPTREQTSWGEPKPIMSESILICGCRGKWRTGPSCVQTLREPVAKSNKRSKFWRIGRIRNLCVSKIIL